MSATPKQPLSQPDLSDAKKASAANELMSAMRQGSAQLLAALEADSSAINVPVENKIIGPGSLIVQAAYECNCSAVEVLVHHGADLQCTSSKQVGNAVDWICCHSGKQVVDTLDQLLSSWVSQFGEEETKRMLNAGRHLGRTPLMNAVMAPNAEAAELLIKKFGADASFAAENGSCALELAAQAGGSQGRQLVKLLLDAGADPNTGYFGPLFLAVQENDEASVQALLKAGARPNGIREGEEGSTTPVECAARFGFLRILKLLVATEGAPTGADLASALGYARERKQEDVERYLLKLGAEPQGAGSKRGAGGAALENWATPSGLAAGVAAEEEVRAKVQESSEQDDLDPIEVAVAEVQGGCYRVVWSGRPDQTVVAATPVVICEAHRSYYFEVLVEALPLMVAVGFARAGVRKRFTLPGWEAGTYGVHSDDGLLQTGGSETKVMKGWQVKAGSTLGMGIEWNDATSEFQLFVTRDGTRSPKSVLLPDDIGDVFELYPIVGACRSGCRVLVNFGEQPFAFQDEAVASAMAARKEAARSSKRSA